MTGPRQIGDCPPFLTGDLPGIGGVIKRYDDDFVVEEIPRYEPGGRGSHCFFTIEKRGLSTHQAIRVIAGAVRRRPNDIGYAGLKDAHAVTRQTLSVEHVDPSRIEALDLPRITIVSVSRHTNKIKLGHLAGNRFIIRIRGPEPSELENAKNVLGVLARRGVPNYFGPQRFGVRCDNADVGRAVLLGDYDRAIQIMLGKPNDHDNAAARRARTLFEEGDWDAAAAAWRRVHADTARVCRTYHTSSGNAGVAWRATGHSMRKLYVSAVQSELFNEVLARRIADMDRLHQGDVAWKHANGACFVVENAAAEQPRCDTLEISATGPLFGRRMKMPHGAPLELEQAVLAASGLSGEHLSGGSAKGLTGGRRPLRVPFETARLGETGASSVPTRRDHAVSASSDDSGSFVELRFTLPPGSYATSVLREIMKPAHGM